MKLVVAGIVLFAVVAVPVLGSQTAQAGSGFADVYGAFAPLGVIHRSYGDYLFYGTEVTIPDGLGSACDDCAYQAALLQVDLYAQTGSYVAMTRPRLAKFRADLADFCSRYSATLEILSATQPANLDALKQASDDGLFVEIYDLQQELQSVFETYLDGIDDEQAKWSFAAAFTLRTLLMQQAPETIDASLRDILYGSADATEPPAFVPEDTAAAIEELLTYIGVSLDPAAVDKTHDLARIIYEYVMNEP